MAHSRMKQLLEDIRKELEAISPKHILNTKKSYATQKEITDFQNASGLVFPPELIEFWLNCNYEITTDTRIYKSLNCDSGPTFFMFDEFEYLVAYWKENAGHDFDDDFAKGPYFDFNNRGFTAKLIKEKVFSKSWFSIAIDSFDGAICVDLDPGINGKAGQLIYMMYVGDDKSGPYYTGFPSLTELLLNYLDQLKKRQIEIEDHLVYPLTHI